jgi:hypothetical protein
MPSGRSNCVDQAPALTTTLPTIWLAVLVTTRQPDPSGNSFSTRSARTVPPASVKSRARVPTQAARVEGVAVLRQEHGPRDAAGQLRHQLAQLVGAQPFGGDAVRLPEALVNRLALRGFRALPDMHLARDANDAVELGSEQFAITVERIDVQGAQRRSSGFDSRHPAGGDPAQQPRQRLRQIARPHRQRRERVGEPARHLTEHSGQRDRHAALDAD